MLLLPCPSPTPPPSPSLDLRGKAAYVPRLDDCMTDNFPKLGFLKREKLDLLSLRIGVIMQQVLPNCDAFVLETC